MIGTVLAVVLLPVHLTLWAGMTVYALRFGWDAVDALEQAEASAAGMTVTPPPARTAVAA